MSPKEAVEALRALTKEVNPGAYFTCYLKQTGDDVIGVVIEPTGRHTDRATIHVGGPDFASAIDAARTAWKEREEHLNSTAVRRMALAIIDLAGDGRVLDHMLMDRGFNAGQIAKHGAAACAEATRLAGNAPFVIETVLDRARLRAAS